MTDEPKEKPKRLAASEAAKALSKLGASKGGDARAKSLSNEQRSAIARKAVEARWAKQGINPIPKATHSGELHIGDVVIPCAVLDDGTRVVTQRGFSVALGRYKNPNKKGAIAQLPVFLSANNLNQFVTEDLARSATEIKFRVAEGSGGLGGNIALGYRATLLQEVCNVYLKAKHANKLLPSQEHIADRCLILLNGLATVGIIALIDEATGFQETRERNALAKILEAFVAKELRPYLAEFPSEFYKQMCRLTGTPYPPPKPNKWPRYFGKLTNEVVYERLAPGVLKKLRELTPRDEKGRLKAHLHSRLTEDIGNPKLLLLLGSVITLMHIPPDKDWIGFMRLLDTHHPKPVTWGLFKPKEGEDDGASPVISPQNKPPSKPGPALIAALE